MKLAKLQTGLITAFTNSQLIFSDLSISLPLVLIYRYGHCPGVCQCSQGTSELHKSLSGSHSDTIPPDVHIPIFKIISPVHTFILTIILNVLWSHLAIKHYQCNPCADCGKKKLSWKALDQISLYKSWSFTTPANCFHSFSELLLQC